MDQRITNDGRCKPIKQRNPKFIYFVTICRGTIEAGRASKDSISKITPGILHERHLHREQIAQPEGGFGGDRPTRLWQQKSVSKSRE